MKNEPPKITPLVQKLMPDATEEEQIKATENVRRYLAVLYRIHCRLEAEKELKRTDAE